ncbi:hypothetical protein ACM26V_17875 [Salipaludibacillus sp. HK11]
MKKIKLSLYTDEELHWALYQNEQMKNNTEYNVVNTLKNLR